MSQTENVANETGNNPERENTQSSENAAEQSEQADSEKIDNLPVESIGSYGRIDESPGEESSGSSDYSPSDT